MSKWIDETDPQGSSTNSTSTCQNCQSFQDFQESDRGWCLIFDQMAKSHHEMTQDCILNGAETITDKSEASSPEFKINTQVKKMESQQHFSTWKEFIIIAQWHNRQLDRSIESYLQETEWYYLITRFEAGKLQLAWVAENEVCPSHQAHFYSTEDIF